MEQAENNMWRQLAESLVGVLKSLYPELPDSALPGAADLELLSAAELNRNLPQDGRQKLQAYLNDLPYFRDGKMVEARRQHEFRTAYLPSLLAGQV